MMDFYSARFTIYDTSDRLFIVFIYIGAEKFYLAMLALSTDNDQ